MTFELYFLVFSIILGGANLLIVLIAMISENGLLYAMSCRDDPKPLIGRNARIVRAFYNFMETFPFFAAAILVVQAADIHTVRTELGAELYFWARFLYIPIYAFGIKGLRTIIWTASIVGIGLIVYSACQ